MTIISVLTELSLEEGDARECTAILRERLNELNYKVYCIILPAQYRGTAHLSFLQNIPWVAVFDLFEPSSKQDGLHHACNETSDAPEAKIRTLDEFKEITAEKDSLISTRGTTWIFNNEEMQKGDWIKRSKDCLYRALSAYKQCFLPGQLVCVFLCFSETAVNEMADIMESSFSILGDSAHSCVTIISESRGIEDAFIKASKYSLQRELGECSVAGISWDRLKQIARELVGPSKFEEKDATTELPHSSGLKAVLNKAIHSWDDLEVYFPNPRLPRLAEAIEKERDAFYKGAQVSQVSLFYDHSIPRSLKKEVNTNVGSALKFLSKETVDASFYVKTITVSYEPGSGATTLCRRILWSKRKEYRCAVVKAITCSTDYQIEKLQSIGYEERNMMFSLPVLVLVDNFPESDVRSLTDHIMKRQTKCLIPATLPISTPKANFEITLRKLDEEETARVKNILINIASVDSEKRREAEQVLERERRFIWFGLELSGRDYLKIKERLQNHINNILMAFLGEAREELLEMCCFLNKYSDGSVILPHSALLDFPSLRLSWDKQQFPGIQEIHEAFVGLLFELQDETHGYYGWRPAHSLVSEVVMSGINVQDTAILVLEKAAKGKAYAMKFLRQQVFRIFLERKRISDPVLLKQQAVDDRSLGNDLENEVFGYLGKRTKYSPLIEERLEDESNVRGAGALKVLPTVCEQATQIEETSKALQQLTRFMLYEICANSLDEENDLSNLLERLYNAAKKESPTKLPVSSTGIDAAHMAVDIAASLLPIYTNHYTTKGVLYLLQLTDYKRTPLRSLSEAIQTCRKALEVYDKALAISKVPNHFSMIGKIQAIISLLEIVNACFYLDEMKFLRYLKEGDAPPELTEVLSLEDQGYISFDNTRLPSTILDILNELFGNVKIRQTTTYDENEIRSLNNAKIRASNLRRRFYEITGMDKRGLSSEESSMQLLSSTSLTGQDLALYQQQVQVFLYFKDETPHSTWSNISKRDANLIYQQLKSLSVNGYGSHNDMLICFKACLQLKDIPCVNELDTIVTKLVEKFPNSEWAHFFYYMIYFPIPNGSLAHYTLLTKQSIKRCPNIVQEKSGSGFRKSGAKNFLGKGIGLNAIVNIHEFQWLETKWKSKTHFWRGKEPSERLELVQSQKEPGRKGIISYQGIQIHFHNTRYPNESKDDLWFYLGSTVAGHYAYGPVDKEIYASLKKNASLVTMPYASSEGSTNSGKFCGPPGNHGARKKGRSAPWQQLGAAAFEPEQDREEDTSCDSEVFRKRKAQNRAGDDGFDDADELFTIGGRFNALYASESDESPQKQFESVWKVRKQALSQDEWKTVERRTSKAKESPTDAKGEKSKLVLGTRGNDKRWFGPKQVTQEGKLHHGAFVLGTRKAKECSFHKPGCDANETDKCRYAHGWRGDTLHFVCTKCIEEKKFLCKEKVNHEP